MTPAVSRCSARSAQVVLDAARCWRRGRDEGQPIMPYLHAALQRHECEVLAPVFDSLMLICESCLKRRMTVGAGTECSVDECWLLALLDDPSLTDLALEKTDADPEMVCILAGALCSTRAMLDLTLPGQS